MKTNRKLQEAKTKLQEAKTKLQEKKLIKRMEACLNFLKKHKKLFLILASALLALILAYQITCAIYNMALTKKVQGYFDGRSFMVSYGEWRDAYSFAGNKMSKEEWHFGEKDSLKGDLNEFLPYKAKAPLFGSDFDLYQKVKGSWHYVGRAVLYKDCAENEDWVEGSLEEITLKRTQDLCEHEFRSRTLKKATCSEEGEKEKTCMECGYIEKETTSKEDHKYQNGICTKCRQEKPRETYTEIDSNTWYVYDGYVAFQNAKLTNVAPAGSSAIVTYYAVCRSCRVVADMFGAAGVELNYPVMKTHYCDQCGASTIVKFEIVF